MFLGSFEENNEESFYESYKRFYYSPSIYQDIPERHLNKSLSLVDDMSIFNIFNENKYDSYEPRNILLNEKISTEDKTKFKISLKADIPILYSFEDIEKKIFKNALYEKKFLFDFNSIFIKDEQIEYPYLKKKRFRDYKYDDYLNGFLENKNNLVCVPENKKKRERPPKTENREEHNRMAPDNIIKKIKADFLNI